MGSLKTKRRFVGSVSGEGCNIPEVEGHLASMGPVEGQSIRCLPWPEADSFLTKPSSGQMVVGQDPVILFSI